MNKINQLKLKIANQKEMEILAEQREIELSHRVSIKFFFFSLENIYNKNTFQII